MSSKYIPTPGPQSHAYAYEQQFKDVVKAVIFPIYGSPAYKNRLTGKNSLPITLERKFRKDKMEPEERFRLRVEKEAAKYNRCNIRWTYKHSTLKHIRYAKSSKKE